jgi:hypothetical protein
MRMLCLILLAFILGVYVHNNSIKYMAVGLLCFPSLFCRVKINDLSKANVFTLLGVSNMACAGIRLSLGCSDLEPVLLALS